MSSSLSKIFLGLRWLCLLMIFCNNTPSCVGQQRFCGNRLTQVLELMCPEGFARKARASIDPLDYVNDMENEKQFPLQGLGMFSKLPSNTLAKTRRRRFGVVDECCRKPCTIPEIQSYCL